MADQATSSSSNAKKKSKGQQRLPMKKIENRSSLLVTFCKRRAGLFKKASELCVLCGVQMAIVLFSPANKAYTFGHPTVDYVMEQFFADEDSSPNVNFIQEGNVGRTIQRLCAELDELKDQMKIAEKCGEVLAKVGNENKSWWKKSVDEMNLSELVECKNVIEELTATTQAANMGSVSAHRSLCLDLAI